MKHTYCINFDDDDGDLPSIFMHARGFSAVVDIVLEELRSRMKYGNIGEEAYAELEKIREKTYEAINVYHLPMD